MSMSTTIPYRDFRAGWIPDSVEKDPDNIPDNGLELADNCDINGKGGISKRLGSEPLNETSYEANVKQVEEWVKSTGVVQLFAVIDTNFCKIDEDGTVTTVQALNASAGKVFWFPTITGGADKLYFGDGYKYFVWDGTNCAEVTAAAGADLTFVKSCTMAVYHSKSHRYFFAKKNSSQLAFSAYDDPTNVTALTVLFPTTALGNIIGIGEFGDAMIARYSFGAYVWRGINPEKDAVWMPIPLKAGGFNQWDSAVVSGSLVFPGIGGIYAPDTSLLGVTESTDEVGEIAPNVAIGRVTSVISSITNKDIVCTIDDGFKTYIAYTDTPAGTVNNKVLVNQRANGGGFTRYIGWNVNHWCLRKNGDLLFATNNYIMKAKQTAYNDNGEIIKFEVKTKWFSFADEIKSFLKKMFTTTIVSQQNKAKSTVDVTIKSDNGVDLVTETAIPLNTGFIWGMVYGPTWAGSAIITKVIDSLLMGLRFQVTFTNNVVNEAVDLYGVDLRFKVGKPSGEKV